MQTITELDQWRQPLDAMRSWVVDGVKDPDTAFVSRWRRDWATKVGVVSAYLAPGDIGPGDTWKLQALGVVLGDAMALRTGARWVEVTDEAGTDPCLQLARTGKLVFPMTMVAKRVESGRVPTLDDLMDLVDRVADAAEPAPVVVPDPPAVEQARAVSAAGADVEASAPAAPAAGVGKRVARLVHQIEGWTGRR